MLTDPQPAAGPSPHLTWDELHCWDRQHTPPRLIAVYPVDWRATRLAKLAVEFEAVRTLLASRAQRPIPILVNSAYRTVAYNARIGGSPRSQHVQGRALDLALRPRDFSPELLDLLYWTVRHRAESVLAIRGVGRYNTFVHLDPRPPADLALWDERTQR